MSERGGLINLEKVGWNSFDDRFERVQLEIEEGIFDGIINLCLLASEETSTKALEADQARILTAAEM